MFYTATLLAIICSVLLALTPVEAREFRLLELKEATIGYRNFLPGGHDVLINESGLENRRLDKQVSLFFTVDFLRYLYWSNRVHGTTDADSRTGKGQFRTVGWNFQVGARVSSYLSIEYEHHSQHILDHSRNNRFPVEDSVGVKLFLFKSDTPSETVF